MSLWWCYEGGRQAPDPYQIAVCRAPDGAAARELFEAPSYCVHELTSPALVETFAHLEPGQIVLHAVESLPSAYDRFMRGSTCRDMDWQAMDEAGFEVR